MIRIPGRLLTLRSKTSLALILGFGAIVALMTVLTVVWVSLSDSAVHRMDQIVHNNNEKTELITRMRTAARERTVSLQKMLIMDDPFERDREYLRFNEFGTAFVLAHEAFMGLELHSDEREVFDSQNSIIGKVGSLQAEIIDLMYADRDAEAHKRLLNEAIPLQDRAFVEMSKLLEIQKRTAAQAVEEAEEAYDQGFWLMWVVLGAIIVVSTIIALLVIRRTSEAAQRLHQEKERAQITLFSIADGVITTDASGRIEQLNASAEALTGWSSDQVRGRPLLEVFPIVHERDRAPVEDPVSQALAQEAEIISQGDLLLTREDGQDFAVEYTVSPIFDRHDHPTGAVLVFRDVTETRAMSSQLAYQARHDALTGLFNRSELEGRLEEALADARRYPQMRNWLCYADLDQFKIINDTCGHLAGDEFLKQVANNLKKQLRESDLIARMGGDEFVILLKSCSCTDARDTVERLRRGLQELRFVWEDKSFNTTASMGLVAITANSGGVYDLLRAADTACYIAKDEGRNRVHLYEPDGDTTSQRTGEMEWVHRISRALEEDRFELYQQCIKPLQGPAEGQHCEILVRMLDEDGHLVPPMAFIPAAERYNLMTQIDRWVVSQTLHRFEGHLGSGSGERHAISINLSAQSLCDDDFLIFVLNELDSSRVDPGHICFEITETAAIANLSRAMEFIKTLKGRGCSFALDDFGSGLSSFGYLKNLPVDYLKIDGSFVRDILKDSMDMALVESINQIGHVMGIKTIAEYVEDDETQALLQRIGVDYGQGYGIAKPAPLSELIPEAASAAEAKTA